MSTNNPPVHLRKATQADVGFIFNSWLKSYKPSTFAKNITNTIYFSEHHKVIEKLLKNYETIIACNPEDQTQIYGFINAGTVEGIFCLHYIYIKQSFRNLKIGTTLVDHFNRNKNSASIYTHHTRVADKMAEKYNMVYHPYILINEVTKEEHNSDSKE